MNQDEIEINGIYWVRVSGKLIKLKVLSSRQKFVVSTVSKAGGYRQVWLCCNLENGRQVEILDNKKFKESVK